MRDLKGELEGFELTAPEDWQPKVGDILVGKVVRCDTGWTQHGERKICVVEDEDNGELRRVWVSHTTLQDMFVDQTPNVGERIAIKRLTNAPGSWRYELRVDREEADELDSRRLRTAEDFVQPDPF